MKIHQHTDRIEYWYDPSTRCWWAREVDEESNQIGDAEHSYTRDGILAVAQSIEDEGTSP